jgi:hypothetical protein
VTAPPALAFHPLVSPNLPKQKVSYLEYQFMMTYPRWNKALSWIRRAKAWDNGISGARFLLELTERFGKRLTKRQYVRNQVQIYLFMLDTLERAKRRLEYDELWKMLRARDDLTVSYRASSPAARSEYVVSVRGGSVEVNLLWLCRSPALLFHPQGQGVVPW